MATKKKTEAPVGKPIPGYPSYLVLPNGKIWNVRKGKYQTERIINGYVAVVISEKGNAGQFYVGHLVGTLYVHNPNPQEFDKVRWKDNNKLNNHKDNIEWTNQQIATKLGRTGVREKKAA